MNIKDTDRLTSSKMKDDFLRAAKPFLLYLASAIILVSMGKDIAKVGFRLDWFLIRVGYLPFMVLVFRIWDYLKNGAFAELPVYAAVTYIVGFCTYFSLSTGGMSSDYVLGIIQLLFGLAIMPISAYAFAFSILSALVLFVGINRGVFGVDAWPTRIALSNNIPLFLFSVLIFFITTKIRKQKIQLQCKIDTLLAEQDSIIRTQSEKLSLVERDIALAGLAAQVAHDIRSPLAALGMIERELSTLPEDTRAILRHSISRIRDIANHLLNKNKLLQSSAELSEEDGREPILLVSLLDAIITEKRINFRSKIDIIINGDLESAHYGLFSRVYPIEFGRVISNLINNGVEAVGDKGQVDIGLSCTLGRILITIRDNGPGIPSEVLSKLGKKGGTYGKENGSGLGLYHAKTKLEEWGGELLIASTLGTGTTVTIDLPRVSPPSWFVPRLQYQVGQPVVVLDDDTSIHEIWRARFASHRKAIQMVHFSTPAEFQKWFLVQTAGRENALYLFDYELIGFDRTGLDLIEESGIQDRAILVTSRFEEANIKTRCERLGVKLIPKGMASMVPIDRLSTQF